MNKLIVAVFENQTDAFEASAALTDLHREGDISIFGSAIIEKDQNSQLSVKQQKDNSTGEGWAMGFLGGSLVGALAGPAGLAVGASVGGMTGLAFDMDRVGVDAEFVEEVSQALKPGNTAVILDVEEGWVTPVDTRVENHNGIVFRRNRSEVIDDQLLRESEMLNAEYKELKADMAEANDEMKASMQKHYDAVNKKVAATEELINKRMKETKESASEKSKKLKSQLEGASSRRKKKIQQRLDELDNSIVASEIKLNRSLQNLMLEFK